MPSTTAGGFGDQGVAGATPTDGSTVPSTPELAQRRRGRPAKASQECCWSAVRRQNQSQRICRIYSESLLPVGNAQESFLKIYCISDYLIQRDDRIANFPNLNASLIHALQTMLHEHNPYIRDFKTAKESLSRSDQVDHRLVINADQAIPNVHRGRQNKPTSNEVSVLMVHQECDRINRIIDCIELPKPTDHTTHYNIR